MAISDTQAKQAAEKSLLFAWASANRYEWSTTTKHLLLDPADVVNLPVGGKNVPVFIGDVNYGDNGVIKFRGFRDEQTALSSIAVPASQSHAQIANFTVGPTKLFYMDLPAVRDADSNDQVYIAVGKILTNWRGAAVVRASSGEEFALAESFERTESSTYGTTTTLLAGTTHPQVFDRDNTLTIQLSQGSLASATEANVLNGANLALCGNEWIRYVNATDNGGGSWTIDTLLRGRRNTEDAIDTHAIGDRFVLINFTSGHTKSEDFSVIERGSTFSWKAVTFGQNFDDVTPVPFKYNKQALLPYSPVHIKGVREGSPNQLNITWFARTRTNGQWVDFRDVILSDPETFEVDIIAADGSVVRTIDSTVTANGSIVLGTQRTAVYDQNDQIADLGSESDPITIKVYQMSAQGFRGKAGTAEVG